MRNTTLLALVAVVFLYGCGGDDDSKSTDKPQQTGQASRSGCLDSWNAASKDVRAQASLSHRGDEPKDVYLGTYNGAKFTATGESYDASGSSTSADVSISPGDCVAVDRTGSNDAETNWVMVASKAGGGGKSWYFLDETDDHPLAKSPQPLEGEAKVTIAGFGEEAKLAP